jgi:hypothetical protein
MSSGGSVIGPRHSERTSPPQGVPRYTPLSRERPDGQTEGADVIAIGPQLARLSGARAVCRRRIIGPAISSAICFVSVDPTFQLRSDFR